MKWEWLLADFITLLHGAVFFVILLGWLVPAFAPFYIVTLAVTLGSELALGYCFLSDWEFRLRKRVRPELDYPATFSSYYTGKLMNVYVSDRFVKMFGTLFLGASLMLALARQFL